MPDRPVLQYRRLWLGLGWALVGIVWYLSLTPRPLQLDMGITFFDKISHFTGYAVLMGWFMQLYQATRIRLAYAVGFMLMGMVIEFLQGMGPSRLFEWADMLANTLGVITALVLVRGRRQFSLYRLEQAL